MPKGFAFTKAAYDLARPSSSQLPPEGRTPSPHHLAPARVECRRGHYLNGLLEL